MSARHSFDARTIGLSVAVGGVVVLLTMAFDLLVDIVHPHGFWIFLLDDVLMGVVCAVIVLLYEQRRRRELAARLNVVAELNHRVRNALQVIQYSAHATQEKQHIAVIGESVARIEAALREILEGRRPKGSSDQEGPPGAQA